MCPSLRVIFYSSLIAALIIAFMLNKCFEPPEVPDIPLSYWGVGKTKPDDKTIKPFKINFSESELQVLEDKLANARPLISPLEGVEFQYGVNTNYLNTFIKFWKTGYNWKEREVFLNKYPQFKTQIGGLQIHFLHVKPDISRTKDKEVIPVLILHGWPGSVREFYDFIPLLTTPRDDSNFVFEVVAPSLPGYGFSEAPAKPGLGPAQISTIFNELMLRLGHNRYYVHGGDWGSAVGQSISVLFPDRILGFHSNFCLASTLKARVKLILSLLFPTFFVETHKVDTHGTDFFDTIFVEFGYFHLQATKPDTIGVSLNDSPVGLAAYILEKFSTWTNRTWREQKNGGLDVYDKTDLLDNIMIYWMTKSITSSMRLYSEAMSKGYTNLGITKLPVTVPSGCTRFPNELMYVPTYVLKEGFTNLVHLTEHPKGGHFAAFELPQVLAEDLWNFVKTVEGRRKHQ